MVIRNNSLRSNQENELTPADRILISKKKRQSQLKKYCQYEKDCEKEKQRLRKKRTVNNNVEQNKNVKFFSNAILLDAVSRNDIDEVQNLLNMGTNADACNDDGTTAIHQCCIDNYEEMLKVLIDRGGNVNAVDHELWTPLHVAATCGYIQLCKILIQRGSNLLALNCDGLMPYDICDNVDTLDFIENKMSERGITQQIIDEKRGSTEKEMLSELQALARENKSLEFKGKCGESLLHVAAANGFTKVISFLLSQKSVRVNSFDDDDWQPIHCAINWNHLETVEILLKHGADINAKTKTGMCALDLCDDADVKLKIIEIRDQLAKNGLVKSISLPKRNNSNVRSSSVRRSSLRDKKALSMKEAKDEGMMLLSSETLNLFEEQDEPNENGNNMNKPQVESDSPVHEPKALLFMQQESATSETSQKLEQYDRSDTRLQSVLKRRIPSAEKEHACCVIL